jgi:hypothetical protein
MADLKVKCMSRWILAHKEMYASKCPWTPQGHFIPHSQQWLSFLMESNHQHN